MSGHTQLGFGFDDTAAAPAWTRNGARSKCSARWRHASGWTVAHCGHPTALHPYHLIDPARPGALIVSHNGGAFTHLADAKRAVEGLISGELATEAYRGRHCVVAS
jgi:hypothetical protein